MNKFTILSLTAISISTMAQSVGNSPYAAFGIGDIKYDNTIETSAMGGISTAYIWDFNNQFNFKNPAANTNLELTSLRVQGTGEFQFYKSNYNNLDSKKQSSYLSGISIAFPLSKKIKFGFGFQPYSSKKYDIITTQSLADNNTKANRFSGEGTLNTIQAAFGYSISPKFNLGLRSNFYFGKLIDREELFYSNAELINGFETNNRIKSFNFTLGSTYVHPLKNNRKITAGATYTFGTTGDMKTDFINSTYYYYGADKKYETILSKANSEDKNLIPTEISLGLGYGRDTRWFAGTQFDFKKGSNSQFLGKEFIYQNSYRFAVGGWYLPNYNNFRNYLSRVTYRFGTFYEKGNLKINNTNINKFGMSIGASFPYKNSSINRLNGIDMALEIGKQGTTQNQMISQGFINLKIGINFADKWFNKNYYN